MQGQGDYAAVNQFCLDNFSVKLTMVMNQKFKFKAHLLQNLYHMDFCGWCSNGQSRHGWVGQGRQLSLLGWTSTITWLCCSLCSSLWQTNLTLQPGWMKGHQYRISQDKLLQSIFFNFPNPLIQSHLHPSIETIRRKNCPHLRVPPCGKNRSSHLWRSSRASWL